MFYLGCIRFTTVHEHKLVSVWALLILGLLPFKQRVNFPNGRLPLPNCSVFSCVYAAPDARIRRSVLGEMVWLFLPWLFREVFSDWQNGTFISHISLNCGTVCFMLRIRSSNLLLNRIALCSVVSRALSGGPSFCPKPEVNYSDLLPCCWQMRYCYGCMLYSVFEWNADFWAVRPARAGC